MILLLKSQLRFALRHPVGPAASFLGVVLAVLAIVAVHLASQSIRANLDDPSIGGHTHVATREGLAEADYFELRRRWRSGVRPGIPDPAPGVSDRAWAGAVAAMFPVIEGHVAIDGRPRRVIGFDPVAAGGLGVVSTSNDPASAAGLGTMQTLGRFLIDDMVVVSPEWAREIAAGGGAVADVPVVVLEAETQVVLADLPTAQRLLGRTGEIDAIWLRLEDRRTRLLAWLDQLLPGIAASLPRYTDPAIDGFAVTAASRWNPSRRFADAILFNLGMLSLLCVFMATFIAFQASASNAARRRTEHDRLLAIGVPRAMLRTLACAEGLVIGLLGAAVGLGLGSVVADAMLQAAQPEATAAAPTGTRDDGGDPALTAWVVGKAFACAACASTLGPLAEGRFRAKTRFRTVFGVLAMAFAAVGLANGSLRWVFLALAAVCAVQVVVAVPLAGESAARLASLGRSLATRSNLRAAAARSGEIRLALGALSVAAAVAIGMGLMVESLRRDFTAMLDVRLAPGVYIEAASDVPASEVEGIRNLAGVRDARRYGTASARVPQGPVDVRVAQLDAAEAARYGFEGPLENRAMINEVGARLLGIRTGDTADLVVAGRSFAVEVAHEFRDFGAFASRMILPTTSLAEFDPAAVHWRRISVRTDPDATQTLAATLGERYGASRVLDHDQIRSLAMAVFDRSFVVGRSLAALALVVAAVGLYAALAALQAGRRRELRLLSAIGHSRAQLWRLAMAQTAALGAMALIAAVPLGLVIAWLLCAFVNPAAFGWSISLHLDFASIAGPLLFGALAAIAAGAVPAFRMAYRGTP